MVELWRQCVTATGSSPLAAAYAYLAVGALRAGGELREVRLLISTPAGLAKTEVYLALAGVGEANATSFGAATPLMQGPTQYRHLGKPGWSQSVYQYFAQLPIFPLAVHVESGSRWVHVAWLGNALQPVCVVVTATVVGFAEKQDGRDVAARDKR